MHSEDKVDQASATLFLVAHEPLSQILPTSHQNIVHPINQASRQETVSNSSKDTQMLHNQQMNKLAPDIDGINCIYYTLVKLFMNRLVTDNSSPEYQVVPSRFFY